MTVFFLSDGKDLEGVEKVPDIKYMELLRILLMTIGGWPHKAIGEIGPRMIQFQNIWSTFLLCQYMISLPGIMNYIRDNIRTADFFILGHCFITCFMIIVAMVSVLKYSEFRQYLSRTTKYHNCIAKFVKEIHLFNHQDRSDYAYKVHLQVHKVSHFFTVYIVVLMFMGMTLFNLTPLVINIVTGKFDNTSSPTVTYEHSVYYSYGMGKESDFVTYIAIAIINCDISYFCSINFCVFDVFLCMMVFHVLGHLKILKHEIESVPLPAAVTDSNNAVHLYDDQEVSKIFALIKNQIYYHRFIVEFTDMLSSTFSQMLCLYYIFHQITECLLLLECSTFEPEALMRFGPLTIIQFQQFIQVSIIYELIGTMSENLIDAVYSMPWEHMDYKHRRIVVMFLKKVQTPIQLKAAGIMNVGVQTMAAILRRSLSYFVYLRTVS